MSYKKNLTQFDKTGAAHLEGWLNDDWWLTSLPQWIKPFRQTAGAQALVYYRLKDGFDQRRF